MNIKILVKFLICLVIPALSISPVFAQEDELTNISEYGNPNGSKTVLIINSYNENNPWTRAMITPITYYIAGVDDLHAELINLNSLLITDSIMYNRTVEGFVNKYSKKKVNYVVFIGQLAFTLRDEIKNSLAHIAFYLTINLLKAITYFIRIFLHLITRKSLNKINRDFTMYAH